MNEAARPACISAINSYHRDHLQSLVVCSRTNEYEAATRHEQLALHSAVAVQPLTPEQIDNYLATIGKPMMALRTALKKNDTFQTLATSPILLHILMLTYHGSPVLVLYYKAVQLRDQVWSDYVQHMVSRKGNTKSYSLEQTCAWLGWLARQMRLHNQTIFSLEQLQQNWLPKGQRDIYEWNVELVFALVGLLIGGLGGAVLGGLIRGLVGGLGGAVFCGVAGGQVGSLISGPYITLKPAETLIWSLKSKNITYWDT